MGTQNPDLCTHHKLLKEVVLKVVSEKNLVD